ncbi:YbhB/YbcL family Raf kinase inhibitor-like protein [Candidatus Microgenomates bacterium]|nr:YbhB/YbcL family Raf kinase inhibitor-like protein [Candidatus Microgenomates bacterium]
MQISSPSFENNTEIPSTYTCAGEGVSPPLDIYDIPEEAKSLALIMDDPDAPMGIFTHWLVWNIDPKTLQIDESFTSPDATKYIAPCPPSGTHRYNFKLYALSEEITIEPEEKEDLQDAMKGKILAEAKLTGLCSAD